jgi:hypothetical protein
MNVTLLKVTITASGLVYQCLQCFPSASLAERMIRASGKLVLGGPPTSVVITSNGDTLVYNWYSPMGVQVCTNEKRVDSV